MAGQLQSLVEWNAGAGGQGTRFIPSLKVTLHQGLHLPPFPMELREVYMLEAAFKTIAVA